MIPTTTKAQILPSQAPYSSRRYQTRFIPPSKSHTKFLKPKADLDDTFARHEQEQLEKTVQKHQTFDRKFIKLIFSTNR